MICLFNLGSLKRLTSCTEQPSCRHLAPCGCRHPASGYVQGINDLVTPFLAVFLSPHMEGAVGDETEAEFPEEVRWPLQGYTPLSIPHGRMS